MKKFTVIKKEGFVSHDKYVRVYDSEGAIFYTKDSKDGTIHFNLPRGHYATNTALKPSDVRKYRLPPLPARERPHTIPKTVSIQYVTNPHKASIFIEKNLILLDPFIRKQPKPVRVFVRFHELGHYWYSTEKFCDLYATREMLKLGYNPSQIAGSFNEVLSNAPNSLERKNFIITNCEKIFQK